MLTLTRAEDDDGGRGNARGIMRPYRRCNCRGGGALWEEECPSTTTTIHTTWTWSRAYHLELPANSAPMRGRTPNLALLAPSQSGEAWTWSTNKRRPQHLTHSLLQDLHHCCCITTSAFSACEDSWTALLAASVVSNERDNAREPYPDIMLATAIYSLRAPHHSPQTAPSSPPLIDPNCTACRTKLHQ